MIVKCTCGNTFTTHSTKGGNLSLELCNECHPYFTGKQKLVATAPVKVRESLVRW